MSASLLSGGLWLKSASQSALRLVDAVSTYVARLGSAWDMFVDSSETVVPSFVSMFSSSVNGSADM